VILAPPCRFALLALAWPLCAQWGTGELRIQVSDPAGLALEAPVTLVSQANQVRQKFSTDASGRYTVKALPFGLYKLQVEHAGFSPFTELLEVRSQVPVERRITLGLAPVETTVTVNDSDTLLDPRGAALVNHLGADLLRDRPSAAPGRSVLEMVNTQPGWLLEANGILHPRGSEYQVQYVIDGIPLFDNRSPAFAQSLGIEEFGAMSVRTAGYPAEYGRKLGGVIEVDTARDERPGFHGSAAFQAGSFSSVSGFVSGQYVHGKNTVGLSAEGTFTDRYLDPPVVDNFTNHGSGGGFSGPMERHCSEHAPTRMSLQHPRTGFLVPNELLQQQAGQRQDRTAEETLGQISHDHIFSPRILGNVRLMARDTSAALWGNPLSTPILPTQERGFREVYASASLSAHLGKHELKAGADAIFGSIHENFSYRIIASELAGVPIFDPALPASFRFAARRQDREQSAFVQDLMRFGNLSVSAGIRFDHYRLMVDENAVSPRLAVAWHFPKAGLVLRAAYDRVFQTPAVENVILASSDLVQSLGGAGASLRLRPSRGNFYEAGFSKSLFVKVRLDASYYRRDVGNFADDDLLLNTGVSFPIAFTKAIISGYEAKLELPRWGPVSGFVSYSNLIGRGQLPVAGGLFLGNDLAQVLNSTATFPITQDQRNTARARFRYQLAPRIWMALGAEYGSGLPVELDSSDPSFLAQQYGPAVIARLNLSRGRVRPFSAVDASLGLDLWKKERRSLRLQADVFNLADRLNVINFAGLFSGTAIAPGRNFAIRLQTEF
jgi:hypothetical protein